MSSWLKGPIRKVKPNPILKVKHNAGFFSCCSFQLASIIEYFNRFKQLPEVVNSSEQFVWYRPGTTETYFQTLPTNIRYGRRIDYEHVYQYSNFKGLDYKGLKLFIDKYFTPSEEVQSIIRQIEIKYEISYDTICVLFYRGNDKVTETPVSPYMDYIERAKKLLLAKPGLVFLVQSDETEFIDTMVAEFPGKCIVFRDEIRHIPKSLTTVDKVFEKDNFVYSKYYLAITIIMSKCADIICGSGNCSIWIALFRGNANGMQQFLKTRWLD
jgi:hypothetical protein